MAVEVAEIIDIQAEVVIGDIKFLDPKESTLRFWALWAEAEGKRFWTLPARLNYTNSPKERKSRWAIMEAGMMETDVPEVFVPIPNSK